MNNCQVFISYRRDGGLDMVGRLTDRLRTHGYIVFFDLESMEKGRFNDQIFDAINSCDVVLAVLPPNGLDRCVNNEDWVRKELAYAMKKEKTIIPIFMHGFSFPDSLPNDIDELRHFEGISVSHDYFDAFIDKLVDKMHITPKYNMIQYHLEEKEYYNIKTSFFNSLKPNPCTPKIFLNLIADLSELRREKGGIQAVTWNGTNKAGCQSLGDIFEYIGNQRCRLWYLDNIDSIDNIRSRVLKLKSAKELNFYTDIILFSIGLLKRLPDEVVFESGVCTRSTFCYILDIPEDLFGYIEKIYYTYEGWKYFSKNLPLTIDVWPTLDMKPDSQKDCDFNMLLLIDIMIDLCLLANHTAKDDNVKALNGYIIRSYYRYLKKKKIYLDKEIQYKIYRYL